jgi:hemoglobin
MPYRSTPVFNTETLPPALRKAHSTKAGVWGRLDILSGSVRYVIEENNTQVVLCAGDYVIIQPQQMHHVEPVGAIQMQIHFYDCNPTL